jgi:hypothetical protein
MTWEFNTNTFYFVQVKWRFNNLIQKLTDLFRLRQFKQEVNSGAVV